MKTKSGKKRNLRIVAHQPKKFEELKSLMQADGCSVGKKRKVCPVCQSILSDDGVCRNCEETWNQEYCEELS